jgi:hypothetical protein
MTEQRVKRAAKGAGCRGERKDRERDCRREYMRRWRACPRNRKKEHARACEKAMTRKIAEASKPEPRRCAFCNSRRAKVTVMRLEPVDRCDGRGAPEEFVEIAVPYCGVC